MANEVTRRRASELRTQHQQTNGTRNGNGGRYLREVTPSELGDFTLHVLGEIGERLSGLKESFGRLTLRQKVAGLTALTVGALGVNEAGKFLSPDPMTQGEQIVFLSTEGVDGKADPAVQFKILSDALGDNLQPRARELFDLAQQDTDEGRKAKEILAEGIDGLIAAGQISSADIDLDADVTALTQHASNLGKATGAGLLSNDLISESVSGEERFAATRALYPKVRDLPGQLIQAQNANKHLGR